MNLGVFGVPSAEEGDAGGYVPRLLFDLRYRLAEEATGRGL